MKKEERPTMYKVLLVDDEERVLDTLESRIKWRQCGISHVFRADNIAAAKEIIQKFLPEILITDIEMPNGSGIDLMAWLKENKIENKRIVITCHPDFDYMRKSMQLGSVDYILKPIDYEELFFILSRMTSEMDQAKVPGELQESLHILTEEGKSVRANYVGEYISEQVEKVAKEYIRRHISEEISIADISEILHCSEKHLSREFKRQTGLTVTEYIIGERITMAKALLTETEWSIQTIASRVGYEDYSYFTRIFKKMTNESPSQYRTEKKMS